MITLLLLLSLSAPTISISGGPPEYSPNVIFGILAFDAVYNGVRVGAFGADPFYKGFLKGAALGACQFSAKLLSARQQTYETHIPIKTIFDVCNSMADNLQDRIGLFSRIHIPFGIGTYTWVRGTYGYVAFSPIGIGSLIDALVRTADFEVRKSLLTMTPVFSAQNNAGPCGEGAAGCHSSGIIYLKRATEKQYRQQVFNHELDHEFFFSAFKHLDTAFDTAFNKYIFNFWTLKYLEFHREALGGLMNLPAYRYRLHEIEAYTLTGPYAPYNRLENQ